MHLRCSPPGSIDPVGHSHEISRYVFEHAEYVFWDILHGNINALVVAIRVCHRVICTMCHFWDELTFQDDKSLFKATPALCMKASKMLMDCKVVEVWVSSFDH